MPSKKIFYYTRRFSQKIGNRREWNFTWKLWPFWKKPKAPYPLVDQIEDAQFGIANIQQFWISYFTATGAICAEEHYGASLIKFDE